MDILFMPLSIQEPMDVLAEAIVAQTKVRWLFDFQPPLCLVMQPLYTRRENHKL